MKEINIEYKGQKYIYPKGITLLEISKDFKSNYQFDILIGSINNKLVELNEMVEQDCKVDFYDLTSTIGNRVYERGIVYLFIKAVHDVLGCDVKVEHSIDRGLYIEILYDKDLNNSILNAIKKRMIELVENKLPFEKMSVSRLDAINYYKRINLQEKADALNYISNTYINLYKFSNLYNYFYGEMPIDTSILKYCKLTLVSEKGIVLRYPNVYQDGKIPEYNHHEKLFIEFKNHHDWCSLMKVNNIEDLNKKVSLGEVDKLIYLSEIEQNNRLYEIAEYISKNENIKVILMGGPSSSGKTTISKKLALYLIGLGLNPHTISIDNYFVNRKETPKNEKGEYDFEDIDALNLDLFNNQMQELLNGKEVNLPEYDFVTGKSEFNNHRLRLKKNDILIIEGLHALNRKLSAIIPNEKKYKIYISPLTSLNLDNHNRVSTSDNRLLRRLVRDNNFRGYSASETLLSWKNVREGEEKNIFPYQDDANVIFNTSLIYELGILRSYVEPLLFSVEENDSNYNEARRLINLLRNILTIKTTNIPLDSIIREFIGESFFKEK